MFEGPQTSSRLPGGLPGQSDCRRREFVRVVSMQSHAQPLTSPARKFAVQEGRPQKFTIEARTIIIMVTFV
jgi:hypothetical protein